MPIVDLIKVLQEFTGREKISIPASSAAVLELASYEPLAQYLNALAKDAKPERAAEDLFTSLARDIAGLKSIPQVFVGDGFVDFLVGEEHGSGGVLIELKPLFTKFDETCVRRHPVKIRAISLSYRRTSAKIDKFSMSIAQFDEWFALKLEEDVDFRERWERYRKFYDNYKQYLARDYAHQGSGDWNLFKLFIEADLRLVRKGGRLSLLVLSSIQTDEGCTELRRWFTSEHTLDELTSFENRGYRGVVKGEEKTVKIFPDVDNRFKFGFFKLIKDERAPDIHTFDARFYVRDPARAADPPIKYSVALMRRFFSKVSFIDGVSVRD